MEESTRPAPPPADAAPDPTVPEGFYGFCSGCFYNLHGLTDARCPECGKPFSPSDPRTFSYTPGPDRLRKTARRTVSSLLEVFKTLNSAPDAEAARRASVAGQLVRLRTENAALRQQVETLKGLLVAKGVLDAADLEAINREVEQAMTGPEIIDDTKTPEDDEASADLLDLGEAARGPADPA